MLSWSAVLNDENDHDDETQGLGDDVIFNNDIDVDNEDSLDSGWTHASSERLI